MKKFQIIALTIQLLLVQGVAQQRTSLPKRACGFNNMILPSEVYTWDPESQALEYIKAICKVTGINENFIVRRASVDNAIATIDQDNNRIIYYGDHFFDNLNNETYKVVVLAHEIGHHLNNNLFPVGNRRPSDELDADRFAGTVLARLALDIKDGQKLLEIKCSLQGNGYYPARSARIEALKNGYNSIRMESQPQYDENYAYNIKSLLYKVRFGATINDVLNFEFGPNHGTVPYENLPVATECAGETIRYFWRYLKDTKLNTEIYAFLDKHHLRKMVFDESFVVYVFKDNHLARVSLRIFSDSPEQFELRFYTALGQDVTKYPLRYKMTLDGNHFISGCSFTDVRSTEIYMTNETGYGFCIHDWWYK
jgi:hypothetical protein